MLVAPLAAFTLVLAACGGDADEVTADPANDDAGANDEGYTASFRLATTIEAEHPYNVGAQEFADRILEATDGRIEIEIFHSQQLGSSEREMLEGLQQGTIDMTVVATGPVSAFSESILLVDLPFLFRDHEHVDNVLDGDIGRELLDDFEQADIKGLAFWENGFRHLSNAVGPIEVPEDAEGVRLRTMENPVHLDSWRAWGTDPTPMAWGEVYTALQQGVVDGQENPIPVFVAASLADVQSHLTLTGHFYSPAPIAMSLERFDEMPEADQQLFIDTAMEVAPFQRDLVRTQEIDALPGLEELGVEIIYEVDHDAWREASAPVYEEWADEIGEERIDAVLNHQ